MEITWTFALLEALAFAIASALEGELAFWKQYVNERLFLYLRGVLATAAFIASQAYPDVPDTVMIGLGAVVVFLGVLGYWPKMQRFEARWIK